MASDVVQSADVWMRERSNRARFAREASTHLLIERDARRKNFDRDLAIETRVSGAKDFPHPARAEKALDPVWTQERTGAEIGTISEEWRRGRPDGSIEDDLRRLLLEQRLNLAPQCLVAPTGLAQKGVPRGRILVEGQVEDSGDVLPPLWGQVHLWLRNTRVGQREVPT
jgi:hypothetical protein